MDSDRKRKLISEVIWLVGIIATSAAIEYIIISLFDLHPILSVKIQGLIGLAIIAYGIRTLARLGQEGIIPLVDDDEDSSTSNERQPRP
ncbi:MAG: hypothetical protein U5J63_07030 [Fodinibius sp.]|nr:hypothetical protein [Fodinibius sp.]